MKGDAQGAFENGVKTGEEATIGTGMKVHQKSGTYCSYQQLFLKVIYRRQEKIRNA